MIRVIWTGRNSVKLGADGAIHKPYVPFEIDEHIYSVKPALYPRLLTPERYRKRLEGWDMPTLQSHCRQRGLQNLSVSRANLIGWCMSFEDAYPAAPEPEAVTEPPADKPAPEVEHEPRDGDLLDVIDALDEAHKAQDYNRLKSALSQLDALPKDTSKASLMRTAAELLELMAVYVHGVTTALVLKEIGGLVDTSQIDGSSTPSTGDIDDWIEEAASELNTQLTRLGIDNTADLADDNATQKLEKGICDYAAAQLLYAIGWGSHAERFETKWEKVLHSLSRSPSSISKRASLTLSDIDTDADKAAPFFSGKSYGF